jgi:ABC-type amino acid transport substrate-binding protein
MRKHISKHISKHILLALAVMCLLFLSGCSLVKTNNSITDNTSVKDDSLTKVKERGKLIAGSSPPYGVMEFYDEPGTMVGIDVDIAREIARIIGVGLEMKEIDFDSLRDSVRSGEADIAIAAMTITPERLTELLFSVPYFSGGQALIVRADDKTISMLADLNGRKIGVEDDGTSLKDAVLDYVENPEIVLHKESEGIAYTSVAVDELKNGEIDAFVVDYIAAISIIKENPDLKILGEPFTQEYYGIATKLGNYALMDEINRILRDMKRTGRLDEIKNKWLK